MSIVQDIEKATYLVLLSVVEELANVIASQDARLEIRSRSSGHRQSLSWTSTDGYDVENAHCRVCRWWSG